MFFFGCSDSKDPSNGTVNDQNNASVMVNAGGNQVTTLPDTVVNLTGTAEGKSVTWSVVEGDNSAIFESANSIKTRVILNNAGNYKFRLTVLGSDGVTKTSDTLVTVKPNPTVLSEKSTPLDHLKVLNKPTFKAGHTMLPLSQWSCGVEDSIRVELLKNWGYSAQFIFGTIVNQSLAKEIKANPGKYPVELAVNPLIAVFRNYEGTAEGLPVLPADTWLRDADGKIFLDNGIPKVSPIAPDDTFFRVGQFVGEGAAKLEQELNHPIHMINNGGEYGLWVLSEDDPNTFYGRDPKVLRDFQESGNPNWYDYNAKQKARQERILKAGIYSKLKKSNPFYSWYQESYGAARGRWWGWEGYHFRWENYIGSDNKPVVSDYSSPEMYYSFQNSGWTGYHKEAMIPMDALTGALKNAGGTVKLGQKYMYPWVSMGWVGGDSGGISDEDTYVGMMKAYYTIGAIGGVSGDFTCAGKPFLDMYQNNPVGTAIPVQIKGFYLLSQVHALFSHLKPIVDNSVLLPGPNVHAYTSLGDITPAMEFTVDNEVSFADGLFGKIPVPTARVVARKTNGKDQWLITAWANTGNDRNISVMIDQKLGKLKLLARRSGSVYLAELKDGLVNLKMIDSDGMNPTRHMFP
jgi:hypothetical protein